MHFSECDSLRNSLKPEVHMNLNRSADKADSLSQCLSIMLCYIFVYHRTLTTEYAFSLLVSYSQKQTFKIQLIIVITFVLLKILAGNIPKLNMYNHSHIRTHPNYSYM